MQAGNYFTALWLGMLALSSGCFFQAPTAPSSGATTKSDLVANVHARSQSGSCGGGLTGAISVTSAAGALPGVSQYLCASMATIPPYNGPDPSSGGSGQTFSFKQTSPSAPGPATLNNSIAVVILAAQATGTYDLSAVEGYIQYGYLNNSYCASPTGSITITSLGNGVGAGTFTASALCDLNGNVQYTNLTGSFHIP